MTVRGFGEKTRHDYVRHVRTFSAFIGRSPDTATAEEVRRFQLHQTETGVGAPSINSAVSALRFLFSVTLERPDLARRLTVVRQPRKLPLVLSVAEVALLLEAAPGPKYKAALATAYGAGLRVAEVVALKVGDVDSSRMMLRVEQGKGRRDRYAMLSPQLLALLRAWWREGRRLGVMLPQGWLFPGRDPVNPLTTRQLNRAVHAAAAAAGINKRVTPHTLRHSFATHLLEQDIDIRVIQVLLGHAKLDTTALYARVATTTIRAVMSPLDRLGPLAEGKPERRPDPAAVRRPRLEVADIFRHHGAAWRRANAGHVSLGQLQAMSAIVSCRTAALGGHVAAVRTAATPRSPTIPAATATARTVREPPAYRGLPTVGRLGDPKADITNEGAIASDVFGRAAIRAYWPSRRCAPATQQPQPRAWPAPLSAGVVRGLERRPSSGQSAPTALARQASPPPCPPDAACICSDCSVAASPPAPPAPWSRAPPWPTAYRIEPGPQNPAPTRAGSCRLGPPASAL